MFQTVKEISRLLSKNRARNDLSNQREFLIHTSERHRQTANDPMNVDEDEESPSCARADARSVDRDSQMKYDIAKNADGPLRKTMKHKPESNPSFQLSNRESDDKATGERLENIENHLAVRYGKYKHLKKIELSDAMLVSSYCRNIPRAASISGRIYDSSRAGLSSLGSSPFQPTPSWSMLLSFDLVVL